jgi:monolysocardiolipin acyltransferase
MYRLFSLSIGATMPYRVFWNRHRMRWALGADDIVFTTSRHKLFFTYGKTIPITRGDGVYQRPMNFALEQINLGGWMHIFPEGMYWNLCFTICLFLLL